MRRKHLDESGKNEEVVRENTCDIKRIADLTRSASARQKKFHLAAQANMMDCKPITPTGTGSKPACA